MRTLTEAFAAIPDAETRASVLALVRSLAAEHPGTGDEQVDAVDPSPPAG